MVDVSKMPKGIVAEGALPLILGAKNRSQNRTIILAYFATTLNLDLTGLCTGHGQAQSDL